MNILNTIKNIVVKRVDIPEDKQRFQKVLQYTRSKVDYVISEKMYMIRSDMNLRIRKIKNYNTKILESKSYFKLGINEKTNLDEGKGKPDAKPKSKPNIKSNKEHKRDIEPDIRLNKECKQDVKMIRTKPDTNKITYEEEKVATNAWLIDFCHKAIKP